MCYFHQLINALEITVKLLTTNVNEGFNNLNEANEASVRMYFTQQLFWITYPKLNSLACEVFKEM